MARIRCPALSKLDRRGRQVARHCVSPRFAGSLGRCRVDCCEQSDRCEGGKTRRDFIEEARNRHGFFFHKRLESYPGNECWVCFSGATDPCVLHPRPLIHPLGRGQVHSHGINDRARLSQFHRDIVNSRLVCCQREIVASGGDTLC